MTEEDAERTLTIGSSHFINLSSASIVCSKFAARERRIVRVSAGELQACNWAIKGRVRRLFFVSFSYRFREVSKTACKLAEEELGAVGVVLAMATTAKRGMEYERGCWRYR